MANCNEARLNFRAPFKSRDCTEVESGHFRPAKFVNSGLLAGTSKVISCSESEVVSDSVVSHDCCTTAEVGAIVCEAERVTPGND